MHLFGEDMQYTSYWLVVGICIGRVSLESSVTDRINVFSSFRKLVMYSGNTESPSTTSIGGIF